MVDKLINFIILLKEKENYEEEVMAHKKSGGVSRNGRDSIGKRLGIKRFDSQIVKAGNIIVRQRGTKYLPGFNVKRSKDDTLIALIDGRVKFEYVSKKKKRISVYPLN